MAQEALKHGRCPILWFSSLRRPAALEALDHNQVRVNISIPGPVRKAVDQEPAAYYFATVQRVRRVSCHEPWRVWAHPVLQHAVL